MTPESRGSSSSTIQKGHVTQGWHGLYDWRLQYFNVFQHFPTLDIYRFTCRIWYQPSYSFVQNRLVSKRWIPEIQRFHHVPMNTQNSATILGQIAFQDHGVNQYVSHDFPYLPSFSHHFPMFPSFSHVCCHDIDIPPGTPTSGPTLAPPVPGLVAPWVTWRDGGSGTHVNHVTLW